MFKMFKNSKVSKSSTVSKSFKKNPTVQKANVNFTLKVQKADIY